MAVKLRLKRMGRNHLAFYRLNAIDSRSPRDGRVVEHLGTYYPQNQKVEEQVKLNAERIRYWLSVGATPSDTVKGLIKKAGISGK